MSAKRGVASGKFFRLKDAEDKSEIVVARREAVKWKRLYAESIKRAHVAEVELALLDEHCIG